MPEYTLLTMKSPEAILNLKSRRLRMLIKSLKK